ncbi:hypothetical protein [Paracoccus litorisediminis]|nr:hypothetical protein [Paracoccus litorisediminis]
MSPILALCLLASCSGWTRSAEPVVVKLPELPVELTDCPQPLELSKHVPAGGIGENRMIELWGRDRAAAVSCRNRLLELSAFYGRASAEVGRITP